MANRYTTSFEDRRYEGFQEELTGSYEPKVDWKWVYEDQWMADISNLISYQKIAEDD